MSHSYKIAVKVLPLQPTCGRKWYSSDWQRPQMLRNRNGKDLDECGGKKEVRHEAKTDGDETKKQ